MVTSCFLTLFASFAGVSGTVGATTLTSGQIAKHFHRTAVGKTLTDASMLRLYANAAYGSVPAGALPDDSKNYDSNFTAIIGQYSGDSQSHTHSLTGIKSGSASSLPPYYALAYIMRVA